MKIKNSTIDSRLKELLSWLVPNKNRHVTPFLSTSTQLGSTLSIELTISSSNLRTTHLLWLGLLDVAQPNQGEKPVEMPVLAFKWDLEGYHPVIDQLCSDNVSTLRSSWRIIEPSG